MTANDRTGVGAGSAEWQTPPELFEQLTERFRYDFDPFASHVNALTDFYCTVDGTFGKDADFGPVQYSSADGLSADWSGMRPFVNPPYSTGLIGRCVQHAFEQRLDLPVCTLLVPAATETHWFQRYVLEHCDITWLDKRVKYVHPPFECGPRCQTGATPHQLGRPVPGSPGPSVVATYKFVQRWWTTGAAVTTDLMERGEVA